MEHKGLKDIFLKMNHLHVMVVGDVMLDNYWWGEVERISPEGPVPVVSLRQRESRLGGAANVALNCKALGAKVVLASIIGDDNNGKTLVQLADEAGIDTQLIHASSERPTTSKTRVISRSQQMMRLDEETLEELSPEEEHPLLEAVLKYIQLEKPDVLIFEDYNKGVLKENIIERITTHCNATGTITAVDPKKKNFLAYKEVTIFKPNLKEIREGLNIPLETVNNKNLLQVHQLLQKELKHEVSFITLSEKGVFYAEEKEAAIIPSHIRNIADVSGAGDTVIATASMVYALTKKVRLMAIISNIAGGLVCEEVGVVPINKEKLIEEVLKNPD